MCEYTYKHIYICTYLFQQQQTNYAMAQMDGIKWQSKKKEARPQDRAAVRPIPETDRIQLCENRAAMRAAPERPQNLTRINSTISWWCSHVLVRTPQYQVPKECHRWEFARNHVERPRGMCLHASTKKWSTGQKQNASRGPNVAGGYDRAEPLMHHKTA